MKKHITTTFAITIYQLLVMTGLVIGSILSLMVPTVITLYYYPTVPAGAIIIGVVSSILFVALFLTNIPYLWHVWACDNVDNVYELKKAVDLEVKLPSDWQPRLAERNPQKYERIKQQLNKPYVFIDDTMVLNETMVVPSKTRSVLFIFIYLIAFSTASYISLAHEAAPEFGLLLIAAGLVAIVWKLKLIFTNKPDLIISNKGITTEFGFIAWQEITNERVAYEKMGRDPKWLLEFDAGGTAYMAYMNGYNISSTQLIHLLMVYRGRHEALNNLITDRNLSL